MRSSKWLIGLVLASSLCWIGLSTASALADTIPTGVQTAGGLITAFSGTASDCSVDCAGAGDTTIVSELLRNGTVVASDTSLTGYSCETDCSFDLTGLDIPFYTGDDIEVAENYPYPNGGLSDVVITGTGGGVEPLSPTIAFYSPSNGTTTTDFYDWYITINNVSTSTEYRVDVEYQAFGGGTTYDDFNLLTPSYLPGNAIVPKTNPLMVGTAYSATAYITTNTSTAYFIAETDPGSVLASTSIYFGVEGSSSSTPSSTPPIVSVCPSAPPIFELTDSLPYFTINNPIPSIESGGCNILLGGFEMTSDETADIETRFSAAGTEISTKPPIGYFALAIGDMESFGVATSSTSTILDATSTSEIYSVYEPLDAGVASIIGFMLLLWFFNRGRHFNP